MAAPPEHKRRPRGNREQTRREIVEAATAVFAAHGSTNGSLAEVGERVGMTHAGVLHHFGSKTNLLLEVIRARDRADLDEISRETIPEGEDLFAHLMRTIRHNQARPGIVQAYAVLSAESVTTDHPAKPYFTQRFDQLRQDIAGALRQMASEKALVGEIDDETIEQASCALVGAMDGIQNQWLLAPDAVDLVGTTRFVMNAILERTLGSPHDQQ